MAQTAAALPGVETPAPQPQLFRLAKTPVGRDAELLTVFGSLDGLTHGGDESSDVPLVSILRDTLGDDNPENDRLRYVWMLTYTRPTMTQRVASAVPFLYSRVGNKKRASRDALPPPVIDLSAPERDMWNRFMWLALKNLVFNPYGVAVKSSANTLTHNLDSYRQAHILRALAILSLYEAETGEPAAFTSPEMAEIQGRLSLTNKTFGGLVDDSYLERVYAKQSSQNLDARGHNWELLRQRAEAEGLYFEPLLMPDGSATHALLWVARPDLEKNKERKFDGRFLNIASPWKDRRLARWKGFVETRRLDAVDLPSSEKADGREAEMIPLALYGLDNPKIPTLLVDFRSNWNPKSREMSHRVIEDVTRNVLALSRFGDIHYFLGRTVFDFVTGRRGLDINQPSRVRSYSQLKLLLSLDASLDPALREEIGKRVEAVSLNPLENDLNAEARLAREQYAALLDYAKRADGLGAKLDRDRRAEMVPLAHGRTSRVMFRFANLLSLGLYTHREDASKEEQLSTLDAERRLAYHRRFLNGVAKASPLVEVVWNIEDVRRSLRFITEHGSSAGSKTAVATARVFAHTQDAETKRLCLDSLYRINNETAKNELLRIYQMPDVDPELRLLTAQYLRRAIREDQRIAPSDAKAIVSVIGQ
ncbi:MAG: hypothetical protein WCD76_01015 [Pyrinomonadaceae bacterium]